MADFSEKALIIIKEHTAQLREFNRWRRIDHEQRQKKAEAWLTNAEMFEMTVFNSESKIRQARLKEKVFYKTIIASPKRSTYLYDLNSIDEKFLVKK